MADRYVCVHPSGYTKTANENARYAASYTSLSAAESAEDGSFSDDLYIEILNGDATYTWNGSPDTTGVEFKGWNMTDGAKVIVKTLTAAEHPDGIASRPDFANGWDTSKYILKAATPLEVDNDHQAGEYLEIEFIGLQLQSDTVDSYVFTVWSGARHTGTTVNKCWLYDATCDSNDITVRLIDSLNPTNGTTFVNTVINANNSDAAIDGGASGATNNVYLYNCTIFGSGGTGIYEFANDDFYIYNCIVGDNNDDFTGIVAGNYNCSDDGDAPGTNVLPKNGADDWTADLTTPWSDLNVKDTNANIYLGSPLSQADDGKIPADDIAGNPRNTGAGEDVCIGAFEYVAAAGDIYNESITETFGQNDIIKATSINNISAIETLGISSLLNMATVLGLKLEEGFSFLDILEILLPEGAIYSEAIIEALGLTSCLPAFYHLFSRGELAALPTDNDNNLATLFSCADYEDVILDDDTYLTQEADEGYAVFLWKEQHTNASDPIQVTWKGKSNVAPADSAIVLQIFNRNSNTWETLDSNNASGADTEITLTGNKTSSLSNYYDSEKWMSFRVYQAVG